MSGVVKHYFQTQTEMRGVPTRQAVAGGRRVAGWLQRVHGGESGGVEGGGGAARGRVAGAQGEVTTRFRHAAQPEVVLWRVRREK